MPALKPELEIPRGVWELLAENDFVNFSVPLLNPPEEIDGELFWSGQRLMMLSDGLAAFESDLDAARHMPYGEMFQLIASGDETLSAQIYSIFFEKESGEWHMMYRMMNCGRALEASAQECWDASCGLQSNWMLSLSGIENWLTLDAYLNYYCKFEKYDRSYVAANIRENLGNMGIGYREEDVRVMAQPGGRVVLVPNLTKCQALVVDIVQNVCLARFVMDDPPHLVEIFWKLHSKMFLNGRDRLVMDGMVSDARHFLCAIKSARVQRSVEEDVTAAAFYL
jgi:hypothetical protein